MTPLNNTEIAYLSRFKENLELAKKYSDIEALRQLNLNKREGDINPSLRELAKRLNIDTPKGSKKQDLIGLISNSLLALVELSNREAQEKDKATKVIQNLDATQTIGRRNIASVCDETLSILEDAFLIQDIDIESRIFKRENILLNYAKTLALQEKALYEFTTINDRRGQIIKRLHTIIESNDKYRNDLKQYKVLADRWYSLYNLEFRDETIIYKREANKEAQITKENSIDIEVSSLYNSARNTLGKVEDGTAIYQDWIEVSIAIGLCTGRRMIEVHSLANFEVIGEYELLFSGQAKNKRRFQSETSKATKRDNFVIPTLLPARQLKLALEWLANTTSKKGNSYRLPKEDVENNSKLVNATYSKALNGAITLDYFNPIEGKQEKVSYHGLRDLYASICQYIFQKDKENVHNNVLLSKLLGHDELDTQTANTYQKFRVTDWQLVRDNMNINPKELISKNNW